jgi:hypothetical protein
MVDQDRHQAKKIKMENLKTLGSKSSTDNVPPWTKSSPLG